MGDLAVMQVQEVRRAVVRFERSKVLRAEMRVRLLARQDRKQKREVGVVRIQQIQLAKIQRVVAGHRGEVGVELVVGLDEEIAVGVGEDAGELAHELVKLRPSTFPYRTIVSEKSPSDWPSPRARRQSPRFSMSACFDSSTSTSRGFVFVASLPICETKPVFDILKWRRRLLTSLRALSAASGVHSVTT